MNTTIMNVFWEQGWGSVKGLKTNLINLINISRPIKIFIDNGPMCNSKYKLDSFLSYAYVQILSDVAISITTVVAIITLKGQIEKEIVFQSKNIGPLAVLGAQSLDWCSIE